MAEKYEGLEPVIHPGLDPRIRQAWAELQMVEFDAELHDGFDPRMADAEAAFRYNENKRAGRRVNRRHKVWSYGPDFDVEIDASLLDYN